MVNIGYQIILQAEDLRIAQHISKLLREKYGKYILTALAEVVDGFAAISITFLGQKAGVYQFYELVTLEAKRFGTGIAKTRFLTPVPVEILLDCLEHFLKLEGALPEQVICSRPEKILD